jgi:hypothetical protein
MGSPAVVYRLGYIACILRHWAHALLVALVITDFVDLGALMGLPSDLCFLFFVRCMKFAVKYYM